MRKMLAGILLALSSPAAPAQTYDSLEQAVEELTSQLVRGAQVRGVEIAKGSVYVSPCNFPERGGVSLLRLSDRLAVLFSAELRRRGVRVVAALDDGRQMSLRVEWTREMDSGKLLLSPRIMQIVERASAQDPEVVASARPVRAYLSSIDRSHFETDLGSPCATGDTTESKSGFATLVVHTEPPGAGVRIATNDETIAYQEGLRVRPGKYWIEVEAQGHETLREYLNVTGNTEYDISLCKLERRTRPKCTNREVTRYRVERRRSTRSVKITETRDPLELDVDRLRFDLEEYYGEIRGRRPSRSERRSIRKILCNSMFNEVKEEGCSDVDGSDGDGSLRKVDCECEIRGDYSDDYCRLEASLRCPVTREVQVPYTATERSCEDEVSIDRICPERRVKLRSR